MPLPEEATKEKHKKRKKIEELVDFAFKLTVLHQLKNLASQTKSQEPKKKSPQTINEDGKK